MRKPQQHPKIRASNEQIVFLGLAAITAVVAVAAMPASTASLYLLSLSIVLWLLTVVLFVLAVGWHFLKWHWPFLPHEITAQIRKGRALIFDANAKRIRAWEAETVALIDKRWGKSSFEYQEFDSLCGFPLPDHLLKLQWELECLKGLTSFPYGPQKLKD